MNWLGPHGDHIIRKLNPSASDIVLDVASGTGEPGLTMAQMLTDGRVVMTDLSDGMLNVAQEKAAAIGLNNVDTSIADACSLPFEDNSFNKVSCRLGLMFVPDMQLALQETHRVLKPGGTFATTVWASPEKNFWVTCMMKNIKAHIDIPAPEPGAPGMFRCAEPGLVARLCRQAGYEDVEEQTVTSEMPVRDGEHYWMFMTSIAAPFVAALSEADEGTVDTIHQNVVRDMNEKFPNGNIESEAIIISGFKLV